MSKDNNKNNNVDIEKDEVTQAPPRAHRRRRREDRKAKRKKAMKTALFCVTVVGFSLACLAGSIYYVKSVERQKVADQKQALVETESESVVVETETETEEVEEVKSIDLVMVGDIICHKDMYTTIKQADGTYDYSMLFEHVTPLVQEADLAIANSEMIIGGEEIGVKSYPTFNGAFSLADAIADAGFNVVLHASNHAADVGVKGVKSCLENWRTTHPEVAVLGIHDSEESRDDIYVYEQDGMKIAILNYTDGLNKSKNIKAADRKYLVNRLTESRLRTDVQRAKEMADFVIVCPHWGKEYSTKIVGKQKQFARICAEEGVNLIIGTHPHVGEKIDTVTDVVSGNQTLVYYSIGNFTTNVTKKSGYVLNRVVGGMAKVKIGRMEDGSVGVLDYGIVPLICHWTSSKEDYTVYPYEDYTEELANKHIATSFKKKFSKQAISDLCDSLWGTYWRKELSIYKNAKGNVTDLTLEAAAEGEATTEGEASDE